MRPASPTSLFRKVDVRSKVEPGGVKAVALFVRAVADGVGMGRVVWFASEPAIDAVLVQVREYFEKTGVAFDRGTATPSGAGVRRPAVHMCEQGKTTM